MPSDATVVDARVTITPGLGTSTLDLHDTVSSGFPAGQRSGGLTSTASGLSLAAVNGSTEFAGTAFDGGIYSGTSRSGSEVVLSGASGTYTSPPISWNGVSYGRLVANFSLPAGASLSFDIVNASLAAVDSNVQVADFIAVDGSAHPSIRIRATFQESSTSQSPRLSSIGAGYVIMSPIEGTGAAQRVEANLAPTGAGVEIPRSVINFTTPFTNPVIAPVGSTWYSSQVSSHTAAVVGNEIWLYGTGFTGSAWTIGRFVSNNGGNTWTADGSPLMSGTAATWDSAGVGDPVVLREDASTWKMWYVGWDARGWADGAQIGLATSSDGLTWVKSPSNPVLSPGVASWENRHVKPGGVVKFGSTYLMSYSGLASSPNAHSVGMATSSDGASWTRFSGNPVISRFTASYTSVESQAGNVYIFDGRFYQYWGCAIDQSGTTLRTCVSSSSDGFNWTAEPGNPIIASSPGEWDNGQVIELLHVRSPTDGRPVWLYHGHTTSTGALSIGRAFPVRVSPASVEFEWDLRAEIPARFVAYQLDASLPASTAVSSAVSTASQSGPFTPRELLSNPDSSIATAPDERMSLNLTASTTLDNSTPRIAAFRLAYERIGPPGTFVSARTTAPALISAATLTYSGSVPMGTSVALEVSNDDGGTWVPAALGAPHLFAQLGSEFRYRLLLTGSSAAAPLVSAVDAHLVLLSDPADVRLETESGSLLAVRAGTLSAAVTLVLDATVLNAELAPFAASDPPRPVEVALFANSSSPGLLTLSDLRVNLTFADPLVGHFGPDSAAIAMEVGERQTFQVWASTTAGVPLTYSWWIDGAPTGDPGDHIAFAPSVTGTYVVRAAVTNGQSTLENNWTVTVGEATVVPSARFFPAASDVALHVGASQGFWAQVLPATASATTQWTIDGSPVGSTSSYTYLAAPPTGVRVLEVSVTVGTSVFTQRWNITTTETIHLPSRELGVAFAPAEDLVIQQNATARFFANLTETSAPPVLYEWQVYGGLSGNSNVSHLDVVGTTPGIYAVWVVVRNDSGVAAHFWNLTVLPPPKTLPNGTTNGGNGTGSTVDTGTAVDLVLLVLTALLGALAAVGFVLYSRERRRGKAS